VFRWHNKVTAWPVPPVYADRCSHNSSTTHANKKYLHGDRHGELEE